MNSVRARAGKSSVLTNADARKLRVRILSSLGLLGVAAALALSYTEHRLGLELRVSVAEEVRSSRLTTDLFTYDDSSSGGRSPGTPRTLTSDGRRQAPAVDVVFRRPTDELIWDRENGFTFMVMDRRLGAPPFTLGNQLSSPEDTTGRKILVVGDSFATGLGVNDLDRVWHRRLATKLGERYGTGAFQVVAVAEPRTSLFTYLKYLTKENLDRIDPEIIMIGILPNDWFPERFETPQCRSRTVADSRTCAEGSWYKKPAYLRCLENGEGISGLLIRKIIEPVFPRTASMMFRKVCDPDRFGRGDIAREYSLYHEDPVASPYHSQLLAALRAARANAGDREIVILPHFYHEQRSLKPSFVAMLEREGFSVADTPNSSGLRDSFKDRTGSALWVNPGDPHPDVRLHEAYARDAFEHLTGRGNFSESGDRFNGEMTLLSNFTPLSMKVTDTSDGVLLTYVPGNVNEVANRDSSSRDRPDQFVSCAEFGRPHSRVMFNPQAVEDGLWVRLLLTSASSMLLSTVSYAADGSEVLGRPVRLMSGAAHDVRLSRDTTGFVLLSEVSGCPLEAVLDLEQFEARIVVLGR